MRITGRLLPVSFLVLACSSSPADDAQQGSDTTFVTTNAGSTAAAASGNRAGAAPAAAAGSSAPVQAASAGSTAAPAAAIGAAGATAAAAAGGAGGTTPAAVSGGAGGMPAQSAAAAAGAAALPAPPVPKPLTFQRCGSFECAEIEVPLDYADPTGEQITLAVRRRATTGAQRIGSLLINPGGPGGSAIEFLSGFVQGASASVLQRFDIVAFDPRGVGQSTPLDCHSTIQTLAATDPSPDSDAEWTSADAAAKAFADECAQKHSKLLPHLGTPNVARDMDQLRIALGDDKLTYVGFSYGTSIGAHYAELFPQNVRALVLDGALDMSLGALDISLEQAVGFDKSLQTFFDWCGAAANNCAWTSGRTPAEAFKALSDEVDAQPLSNRSRPLKV